MIAQTKTKIQVGAVGSSIGLSSIVGSQICSHFGSSVSSSESDISVSSSCTMSDISVSSSESESSSGSSSVSSVVTVTTTSLPKSKSSSGCSFVVTVTTSLRESESSSGRSSVVVVRKDKLLKMKKSIDVMLATTCEKKPRTTNCENCDKQKVELKKVIKGWHWCVREAREWFDNRGEWSKGNPVRDGVLWKKAKEIQSELV